MNYLKLFRSMSYHPYLIIIKQFKYIFKKYNIAVSNWTVICKNQTNPPNIQKYPLFLLTFSYSFHPYNHSIFYYSISSFHSINIILNSLEFFIIHSKTIPLELLINKRKYDKNYLKTNKKERRTIFICDDFENNKSSRLYSLHFYYIALNPQLDSL